MIPMKLTLPIFLLSLNVYATSYCPDVKKAPKCPTSGATIVDDTYPVQAFVVSNRPFKPGPSSVNVTRDFILNIFDSYNTDETPDVILPLDTTEEFEAIKLSLKKKLQEQKVSNEIIEKRLKRLTHFPAPTYTWQQDWFESFIDQSSGRPVIRQMESYQRGVESYESGKLMAQTTSCPIIGGDLLKSDYPNGEDEEKFFRENPHASVVDGKSFGSGEMGGNIEGAPGGLCLLGDNLGKKMREDICGSEKKRY